MFSSQGKAKSSVQCKVHQAQFKVSDITSRSNRSSNLAEDKAHRNAEERVDSKNRKMNRRRNLKKKRRTKIEVLES